MKSMLMVLLRPVRPPIDANVNQWSVDGGPGMFSSADQIPGLERNKEWLFCCSLITRE